MIFKNIIGTTATAFKIGFTGCTIYRGTADPTVTPPTPQAGSTINVGDLYVRTGATGGVYQYNGTVWASFFLGTGGASFSSLVITGTSEFQQQATFGSGTLTDPSIAFIGDTNTGFYHPAADQLGVVIGGAETFRSTATLNTSYLPMAFPDGLVSAPAISFTSDPNTGLYRVGADSIAIATGGTARITMSTTLTGASITMEDTSAFRMPLGTTAERPSAPAQGFQRFNSTLDYPEFYRSTGWVRPLMSGESNTVSFADGSVGTPSIGFFSDTDTGLYRPGANQIGVTIGGIETVNFNAASVNSTVPVRVNAGSAAVPSISFTGDPDSGMYSSGTNTVAIAVGGARVVDFRPANGVDPAVLIDSTSSLRLPVGTTAQRPTNGLDGQLRYNTTTGNFEAFFAATWNDLTFSGAPITGNFADGDPTAPSITFTADADTGIYRPGANQIGFTTNAVSRAIISDQGIALLAGTAAAPSYSFTADPNTGLYSGGADIIGFAIAGAERMNLGATGILTLNNTGATPATEMTGTRLNVVNSSGAGRISIDTYGGTTVFSGRRANGTIGAPTTVLSGESMMTVGASGYDGSAYIGTLRAAMSVIAGSNWSPTSHETSLTFATTDVNSTTSVTRLAISGAGVITHTAPITGGAVHSISAAGSNINAWATVATSTGSVNLGVNTDNAGYVYATNALDLFGQATQMVRVTSTAVGIGLGAGVNPDSRLTVEQVLAGGAWIRLRNTSASASATMGVLLGANASSAQGALLVNSSANTALGGVSSINLGNYGAGSVGFFTNNILRAIINSTGDVGIGTTNSLGTYGKLRVAGTGYQAINVGSEDASGVNTILAANSNVGARIGTVSNHPVDMYVNNAAVSRYDASGRFAVGTTSGITGRIHSYTTGFNPASTASAAAFLAEGNSGGGFVMKDGIGYGGSWFDTSGTVLRFGIGNSATLTEYMNLSSNGLAVSAPLTVSTTSLPMTITRYGAGANLLQRRANGTSGAPTAILTGEVAGAFNVSGYDGANHVVGGQFRMIATGTIGTNVVPMYMEWMTMNLAGTLATRMTLSSEGQLTLANGTLTVAADPTSALQVATKQYVDSAAGGANDYQLFTSSGTWTKPSGLTGNEIVMVELWGGGGGGRQNGTDWQASGGGGGEYRMFCFRAAELSATESVTVGAGGAGGASPPAGGFSSFKGIEAAGGRGGGAAGNITTRGWGGFTPGGAAYYAADVSSPYTTPGYVTTLAGNTTLSTSANGLHTIAAGGEAGGAGGWDDANTGNYTPIGAINAGGGGGIAATFGRTGGTSVRGGAGGTSTGTTGAAGSAPGGGGAGGTSTAGNGARGEVRVTVLR